MTASVQTSMFSRNLLYNKRFYSGNLYTVYINTEDGEVHEYEVEADTFADATKQAEDMAYSICADITYKYMRLWNRSYSSWLRPRSPTVQRTMYGSSAPAVTERSTAEMPLWHSGTPSSSRNRQGAASLRTLSTA